MFTGIVDHLGKIVERRALSQGLHFSIETRFAQIHSGESISVDGVCLTAIESTTGLFKVEVSPETLAKSTLGELQENSLVNLEKALRLGDAMGGHWVTGHVDCTAVVTEVRPQGGFHWMVFSDVTPAMVRWLIPKGSITVNGVSLTVNEVFTDGFSVMLIPHTLEKTNLKVLAKSSRVNLEFDWMVKTVLRDLGQRISWMEEANAKFRAH